MDGADAGLGLEDGWAEAEWAGQRMDGLRVFFLLL